MRHQCVAITMFGTQSFKHRAKGCWRYIGRLKPCISKGIRIRFGLLAVIRTDQAFGQKQHRRTACKIAQQQPQHTDRARRSQRMARRIPADHMANFVGQHGGDLIP